MKNMKKLFSLALALVMMMALVVTAGATSTEPSITITDASETATYTAYKIFDLKYDTNQTTFAYTIDDSNPFKSAVVDYAVDGKNVFVVTPIAGEPGKNYVTIAEGASFSSDDTAAAKAFVEYLRGGLTVAQKNAGINLNYVAETKTASAGKADGITLGYYFIDSTVGTLCLLQNTDPTVSLADKNKAPEIDKTSDNMDDHMQIGDTVNFTITVTAEEGAENYVVHDVMGTGLDLNNDIKVVSPADAAAAATIKTSGLTDGCTFEVSFTEEYLNTIHSATEIVITYSATINANAVSEPIGNKAQLKYGDNEATPWTNKTGNPDPEGPTSTYFFDLVKTTSDHTILENAKFKLTRVADGETVKFSVNEDGNVYTVDPNGTVETITAGNVKIQGLGKADYSLTETEAPAGYNALTEAKPVDMKNGDIKASFGSDGAYVANTGIQVINNTGAELPSTGGIGTTIFTVTGALLMIGAAVLFLTKKRSEA